LSTFDLSRVQSELAGAGVPRALPFEVAVAVVSDTFRLAGLVPPPAAHWQRQAKALRLLSEQLGFLVHLLLGTSLREQTKAGLTGSGLEPGRALEAFFQAVAPLTGEMLRDNRFRQEEFLRRFVACLGGSVAGETVGQSRKKLEQLDYRKTLAEYQKAEAARQKEAERRAQLLREAAQREEYAKGWRE
jgi:hypothetical protein